MKLHDYFKYFLEHSVNLNDSRIEMLDSRVQAITSFLKGDPTLGALAVDVIPQGSYAQKTIIRPLPGRDFDADVLLELVEQANWEASDYIANLYSAFRASSTYKEMVSRKTRCVTVQYANDFHVDVVPYIERAGNKYVTNRHENSFELTDPERFSEWLDEKNRTASLHLVPAIRLLKYLRDFKSRFAVKSIVLTALLGDRVNFANLLGDPTYYGDLATTLVHLLNDLDTYLQANATLPVIQDPGGTGEDFGQRWDQDGYANFRNWIHFYAQKVDAAYEETDRDAGVALWQEVFGEDFKKPPVEIQLAEAKAMVPSSERFIDRDFGAEIIATSYTVRIAGRVRPQPGFRNYTLARRGNRVMKGRSLVFNVVACTVPKPYDVYWKVRNTGAEAARLEALRGEIGRDTGTGEKTETTAYRGSHYVECYIVKDGKCVASDRQSVFVE
jgi:hypothetical protein